ncbi:MAG: dihydroorotate dehydrogenase [Spirochaetales bacterium]|nr:dihydroorotate dehydrogenase [Spirochaetales bacterium]
MKQFKATILSNNQVSLGYFRLAFQWPEDLISPRPGQFVTMRANSGAEPLLRRPFAISEFDLTRGYAAIVYERRGKATNLLAAMHEGDTLDVLGPLGNRFPTIESGFFPILLCGGIGFGPIYFLAMTNIQEGIRQKVIIGAKTKKLLPDLPYPAQEDDCSTFLFCTDDGSRGSKGTVVECASQFDTGLLQRSVLYACGPDAMLGACARLAETIDIKCLVAVEQIIGCGVGACMGCAVKTRQGYARVCTDGPIFDSREIVWS